MTSSGDHAAQSCDSPSEELADIVLDAGRRGFSRWRVATALGISARGLATIEQRSGVIATDHRVDEERQVRSGD